MSNEFSSSTTSTASSTTPMTSASSTNPASYEAFLTSYEAILKQYAQQYAKQYAESYVASLKPKTPAQIRAAGDVKIKIGILLLVGVISLALICIGAIALFKYPAIAKDVWVIIGPILSGAITGTAAYFTGEKQGSQK